MNQLPCSRFKLLASVGANSGIVRRLEEIKKDADAKIASVGANSGIVRRPLPDLNHL